ncbi:ankyrin repeat-containing domain protein [Elsinoe ampelina]|uniref:Ankyrin repeat-containing domain protein n=1 Tax=Elsinoe ampelina TaxID=302913 RepID=A0A6A6G7K3_9PEZI|nr:ankyrin repeat-containing domain protein [Elsinoe ampelina]
MADWLLKVKPDYLRKRPYPTEELLAFAVRTSCQVQMIELLIRHGADFDAYIQDTGRKPLHLACESGNIEAAELFLGLGVNVNERRRRHDGSALHLALYSKDAELVELLIDHGADVDLNISHHAHQEALKARGTPTDKTESCQTEYLDAKGFPTSKNVGIATDIGEVTPLSIAISCNDVASMMLLVRSGASLGWYGFNYDKMERVDYWEGDDHWEGNNYFQQLSAMGLAVEMPHHLLERIAFYTMSKSIRLVMKAQKGSSSNIPKIEGSTTS